MPDEESVVRSLTTDPNPIRCSDSDKKALGARAPLRYFFYLVLFKFTIDYNEWSYTSLYALIVLFCFVMLCYVLFCFVLFCIVLYWFVLFCFFLYCFVLFFFVLFCFVLFCFVLFCFVLLCFVWFCIVLFCFVLYCSMMLVFLFVWLIIPDGR